MTFIFWIPDRPRSARPSGMTNREGMQFRNDNIFRKAVSLNTFVVPASEPACPPSPSPEALVKGDSFSGGGNPGRSSSTRGTSGPPDPPAPLRGGTGLAPRTPFGTVPCGTGWPAPAAVRPNSRRPALASRLGTQPGRLRDCRVGAVPQIDRVGSWIPVQSRDDILKSSEVKNFLKAKNQDLTPLQSGREIVLQS